MSSKSVVILGCGPAGLFAAQAASLSGFEPVIISQKKKSVIYGAQYLHQKIPDLMSGAEDIEVNTIRYGLPERYAQRVYGDATMPTSWEKQESTKTVWSLRTVYENAWEKFEPTIADMPLSSMDIPELSATFDLVISTVPAWSLCGRAGHQFPSVAIMVSNTLIFQIGEKPDTNFVIYNGNKEGLWYRCSSIDGHDSTECIAHPSLLSDEREWNLGFKILDTDCDCHGSLVRAGRMGKWQRGVLTHDAFNDTLEAISDRFGSARSD